MRFLLDENIEYRVALFLRDQGHDVTAIAHDYPHALADHDVLAIAHQEQRVLITSDRDFGHPVAKQHQPHVGVLYFRLPAAELKIARLTDVLVSHREQLDQFLVVNGTRVRPYYAQKERQLTSFDIRQ